MAGERGAYERLVATLPVGRIAELLEPFYPEVSNDLACSLSVYLDLLLKWNARMNLTAVRAPEEMVTRHFGESLFLARHLPKAQTLLDVGSGAGFPGIPVQLVYPELRVTLAESQNKKAAFLREAVRVLGLGCEVWAGRVEGMPEARRFDVVTLRAVDDREKAMAAGRARVGLGGCMAVLATEMDAEGVSVLVPGSKHSYLRIL